MSGDKFMDINTAGKKIDEIEVRISYKIIELFSAGLYSSPNKAFEELICNSYDAFADTVSVLFLQIYQQRMHIYGYVIMVKG